MLDNAISADQVRARAGIALPEAQAAVYMQSAKLEGWTLAEFQDRTGMASREARAIAYRFGIEFEDFDPLSPPVELVWRKAKKGWELYHGKEAVGLCVRHDLGMPQGKVYIVEAYEVRVTAAMAQAAMAQAASKIDALSADLFDGQPVLTRIEEQDGDVDTLFPKIDDKFHACRKAFNS